MKVQAAYHPGAAFVTPWDSLREAARVMRRAGVGSLPVLDRHGVVGIITERDVTEAVAKGIQPSTAHVADYTSDGSVTVALTDDCEIAELKMLAIGCRNLPVVDADRRLVGTISMSDLVAEAAPRGSRLG